MHHKQDSFQAVTQPSLVRRVSVSLTGPSSVIAQRHWATGMASEHVEIGSDVRCDWVVVWPDAAKRQLRLFWDGRVLWVGAGGRGDPGWRPMVSSAVIPCAGLALQVRVAADFVGTNGWGNPAGASGPGPLARATAGSIGE